MPTTSLDWFGLSLAGEVDFMEGPLPTGVANVKVIFWVSEVTS